MTGTRTLYRCAIAALLLLTAGTGCATQVRPPQQSALRDPVPVYLGDFGIHSSLFLPTPDGRFVEYTFTDWAYSVEDRDTTINGVRALAGVSGAAGFGRMYHDALPAGQGPQMSRPPVSVQRVWCERVDVYDLAWRLDGRWQELASAGGRVRTNAEGMEFVRCPDRYSVANNCNHMTARSLRELGCDVSGVIVWSNFRVAGSADDAPLGYSADAAIAPASPVMAGGGTSGPPSQAWADAMSAPSPTQATGVAALGVGGATTP